MVVINGEPKDVAGKVIAEYLEESNYSMTRIVVEKNEEIVPKSEYNNVTFEDGDVIEIVSFVGGG